MLGKPGSRARAFGWVLGLGAVLAFAIIYSLLAAIGPSHMGDDISYAWSAHYTAAGTFRESQFDILSVRILQVVPIGILYRLFGAGIYSSAGWDIISFVLTVLLTYLIGRELYDRRVGLLAALLLAVFPIVAIYSTTMSDNIPLMLFAALAFFAFIKGEKRRSWPWYLVSGLAVAGAPAISPEGFILWIIFGLLFLYGLAGRGIGIRATRKRLVIRNLQWFIAAGFLLGVGGLLLFNYVNCGQPLVTFTANAVYYSQTYRPDIAPQPVMQSLMFYPNLMFPYGLGKGGLFQMIASYRINWNKEGFFFYAFVAAALYLIAEGDRRVRLLMVWFLVGILYLEFGPQSVGLNPLSYVLSHRLDRYVTLVAPPLAIVISAGVARIVDDSKEKWKVAKGVVLFALLAFLVITALQITVFWHRIAAASQYDQLRIANYLNALPNTTKVYFDSGYGDMAVYMGFENFSRFYPDYGGIKDCQNFPSGSYAVVPRYYSDGFSFVPDPLQQCSGWQLALSPQFPGMDSSITAPVEPFEADLYRVP